MLGALALGWASGPIGCAIFSRLRTAPGARTRGNLEFQAELDYAGLARGSKGEGWPAQPEIVIPSDRRAHLSPLKERLLTFEEMYRAEFEFVWRTLQRMGIRGSDVQDACQKVFVIAFRRLSEFEGRSSARTWLCGIALRVASDHRRSAPRRREVLADSTPMEACCDPSQLAEVEHRERLLELDAALSELPEEQRAVLVLFELEEMSGDDIARCLGVPEGTVRSRLRLARQAFSRIAASRRESNALRAVGGAP